MIERHTDPGTQVKWGADVVTVARHLISAAGDELPDQFAVRRKSDWYVVRRIEGEGMDRRAVEHTVHRTDLYLVEPRADAWREVGRRYQLDPD